MALHAKPPVTGGAHTLPFEKLAPGDFERLCFWLVQREGYSRIEHLGEAGSEGGRDVVAWKDGRRFVFQCKRVQAFNTSQARKEIEKLRGLPLADQPHELVFVVARTVSADTRDAIRKVWGDEATCHFWSGNAPFVSIQPGISRPFRPHGDWACLLTQGIGLRPQKPWARIPRPVGPVLVEALNFTLAALTPRE
jgi:hypothetical protein